MKAKKIPVAVICGLVAFLLLSACATEGAEKPHLIGSSESPAKTVSEFSGTASQVSENPDISATAKVVSSASRPAKLDPVIPQMVYGGHSYAVFTETDVETGSDSQTFCERLGGHLATLTTSEENAAVADFVANSGFVKAYFGLVYDPESTPNTYWVTGEPLVWDAWWNAEYSYEGIPEPHYTEFCFVDASELVGGQVTGAYLQEAGRSYEPELVMDGDLTTAWVEGVDGNGEGESIVFTFDQEYGILGLCIAAGYQKTPELFEKNARPASTRLRFTKPDGAQEEFSFVLEDTDGWQTIELPHMVMATQMELVLEETFPGTAYEDTAISEVAFDAILVDPLWMPCYDTKVFVCEWDEILPGISENFEAAPTEIADGTAGSQ